MLDLKDAVRIAKSKAEELLEATDYNVEEIERETYEDRDVWAITLSSLRNVSVMPSLARLANPEPLHYQRFIIDAEDGQLLAIRLRETAAR